MKILPPIFIAASIFGCTHEQQPVASTPPPAKMAKTGGGSPMTAKPIFNRNSNADAILGSKNR